MRAIIATWTGDTQNTGAYFKPAVNPAPKTSEKVALPQAEIAPHAEQTHKPTEFSAQHYIQASQRGDAEATFRLGQLYETYQLRGSPNQKAACYYYLKAVEGAYAPALVEAKRLIALLNDKDVECALAETYYSTFKNKATALLWYQKSADKGSTHALSRLYEISSTDPEFSYAVAQLYEKLPPTQKNQFMVLRHYALAARNAHAEAQCYLEALVQEGNAEAQYIFAQEYHRYLNNIQECLRLCLLAAEQGHEGALNYLRETKFSIEIYLTIADHYVRGEIVPINIPRAIEFYDKAYRAGSLSTAPVIGDLYEKNTIMDDEACENACRYYINAVKENKPEALIVLKRLFASVSPRTQADILALYSLPHVITWVKSTENAQKISALFSSAPSATLLRLNPKDSAKMPHTEETRLSEKPDSLENYHPL